MERVGRWRGNIKDQDEEDDCHGIDNIYERMEVMSENGGKK